MCLISNHNFFFDYIFGRKLLNFRPKVIALKRLNFGPDQMHLRKKNVNVCLSGVIVWVLLTEIQYFKSAILDVIARLCELRPNKK